MERHRAKHAVKGCGTQRIAALSPPVIRERGAVEARLASGEHPTLLHACASRLEGMMVIKPRQEYRLHTTAPRAARRRVWRAEGIHAGRHVALAWYPEHHRPVAHGTALLHRNRPEAPLLHVRPVVASSRISACRHRRAPGLIPNPLARPLPLEPGLYPYWQSNESA